MNKLINTFLDISASPIVAGGSASMNCQRGRFAVAVGALAPATPITINNSTVTPTSTVLIVMETNDANLFGVGIGTISNGAFTVISTAGTALGTVSICKFSYVVFN